MANDDDNSAMDPNKRTLFFTYGTLKQGFHNHTFMQDLVARNDAAFLGDHVTLGPLPLVCGPHGMPFLIDLPGSGRRVRGELYSVSPAGLTRLDDFHVIDTGHYERLRIDVVSAENDVVLGAEAYFAHRGFGEGLWEENRREGLEEYSEAEGARYVKIHDSQQRQSQNFINFRKRNRVKRLFFEKKNLESLLSGRGPF